MPAPLVFVYNADSGLLNALKDLWVKTVAPHTYDCQLCAVTYGPTGMRREWRDFVNGLGRETVFLHRDELAARYGLHQQALPAVYSMDNGTLRVWLSADELRACTTLEALMKLVRQRAEA
ncbi:hypothetical protein MF271_09255 [Deinococcus sp. KNUC1210]|uniref:hypothetical protein n=1 Tax=Deinococcus sp. KNUC1210 TaxID=2917691 RepID=UPI001EEFF82F|nr:hypothetical protein [Deinococcus sp. KNUC1210]ULH16737.1 hypothetical protein MF271_09255 [Deinococcus sp. KNUC1210]